MFGRTTNILHNCDWIPVSTTKVPSKITLTTCTSLWGFRKSSWNFKFWEMHLSWYTIASLYSIWQYVKTSRLQNRFVPSPSFLKCMTQNIGKLWQGTSLLIKACSLLRSDLGSESRVWLWSVACGGASFRSRDRSSLPVTGSLCSSTTFSFCCRWSKAIAWPWITTR